MADLHKCKEKPFNLRMDNSINKNIYKRKNKELSGQLKKKKESCRN